MLPMEELKAFYTGVIRSVLEYEAKLKSGMEIVQLNREMILRDYKSGRLDSSSLRRDVMCVDMIKKMSNRVHKLHHLLPMKVHN